MTGLSVAADAPINDGGTIASVGMTRLNFATSISSRRVALDAGASAVAAQISGCDFVPTTPNLDNSGGIIAAAHAAPLATVF